MQHSASFLSALKRCLKVKGITYGDLATHLAISEASVKRVFAEGTLTLDRISQILEVLDMTFLEVSKLIPGALESPPEVLTFDQESVLAADPRLFAFFNLLLFGRTPAAIVDRYQISKKEAAKHLAILDDLGLVETRGTKVKLRTSRNITWLDEGPLREAYREKILTEFAAGPFTGERDCNIFMTRSLSPGSQAVLQRKLAQIQREMDEMSAFDGAGDKVRTEATALMVAMRPFSLSVVDALKKRW